MSTTAQAQFVNQGVAGAQAAIGRLVQGGEFSVDPQLRELDGVGGQSVIRKGLTAVTLTGVEIFSPDLTYMNKFHRDAVGIQIAAFPDATVGVEGGALHYKIYSMESCQPAKLAVGCSAGAELKATIDVWSADTDDVDVTAADFQESTALLGHTDNEVAVTIDGESYVTREWSFEVDNQPEWDNDQDGKAADSKTQPTGVLLGNEKITASCITGKPIPITLYDMFDDEWIEGGALQVFPLLFLAENATAAQDLLFTLPYMRPGRTNMPVTNAGKVGFRHEFKSMSNYAGLTIETP